MKSTQSSQLISFVALEPVAFLTNRTLEVTVRDHELVGIKVRGALESSMIFFNPRFSDPKAYIDIKVRAKNKVIFRIPLHDIGAFVFEARKVQSVGAIPHFGFILVKSPAGKTLRKLLLLGNQAG